MVHAMSICNISALELVYANLKANHVGKQIYTNFTSKKCLVGFHWLSLMEANKDQDLIRDLFRIFIDSFRLYNS